MRQFVRSKFLKIQGLSEKPFHLGKAFSDFRRCLGGWTGPRVTRGQQPLYGTEQTFNISIAAEIPPGEHWPKRFKWKM